MHALQHIIGIVFLSAFGYILLKEGLKKETADDKLKAAVRPQRPRQAPKWYGVFLGAISFIAAIYFMLKLVFTSVF